MLKNFIIFYMSASLAMVFLMLFSISFLTLWERKLLGGIQRRQGPVFTGIFGIVQPFADGFKLIFKTFNFPSGGYFHVFLGASIFSLVLSLLPWTFIPFNENFIFSDINCNLILIMLISSLNKYTILFSGWSSNSKYGVLGSIRSGAQMASYEIPLLLSIIPIILISSSLSLSDIVYFQSQYFWFICFLPNAFIFFICMLAETNRAPFDLPEAESELVAGYNIEYSSLSFAVFFLAEYNHIIIASFLFSLLFLGGWDLSFSNFNVQSYQFLNLLFKSVIIINLFIFIRGVVPRYRFTDLITMCWQVFVPITILTLVIIIFISVLNNFLNIYSLNTELFLFSIFLVYILIEFAVFLWKLGNFKIASKEFISPFNKEDQHDSSVYLVEPLSLTSPSANVRHSSKHNYSQEQMFNYALLIFIILILVLLIVIVEFNLDYKIYKFLWKN